MNNIRTHFCFGSGATAHLGADSMGAIVPTAKKLWGRCLPSLPQPPQEFCYVVVVNSQKVQ